MPELTNQQMIFREAALQDIAQIQFVRNAALENLLPDAGFISDADMQDYLLHRGKGWVCELDGRVIGFSIADLEDQNAWALFVHPEFERRGIGRILHDVMLDWYFGKGNESIWLSTAPNTRAVGFYRQAGWKQNGFRSNGELRFEMERAVWKKNRRF